MSKFITILVFSSLFFANAAISADKINTDNLEKAGFKEVGKILEKMSPEQLENIIKQAKQLMPQLEGMSDSEIDQMTSQLLQIDSSLSGQNIDPTKIDASNSKDLNSIISDLKAHNKSNK